MRTLLHILFVLDSLALVGLILMQMSRHAGLGGAFGGGGSHTVFGREEQGDPKRTATAWLAAIFMVLAMSLSVIR
jgi:preprotein translocase subunit SecG